MTGAEQLDMLSRLGPLRRDIVSQGYDDALGIITSAFPDVSVGRFRTGSSAWGWSVPDRWTFIDGFIETVDGKRVIDLSDHPLRVGSYSQSVDAVLPRSELLQHTRTHPTLPDALPFTFHYYRSEWTVGLTRAEVDALNQEQYRVVIRSSHTPGEMAVAEWILPGESDSEFIFASHLCHPAQVSDGLSGVVSGLAVMEALVARVHRRYSYRLLIGPETIGSVVWLYHNREGLGRRFGGLFLEMTGLDQPPALQHAFESSRWVDGAVTASFRETNKSGWDAPHRTIVGNDERQFNGPGVRIPMLSLSRARRRSEPGAPFAAYHSSRDTTALVKPERLEQTVSTVLAAVDAMENDAIPVNRFFGEPFLSGAGIDNHDEALSAIPHRRRLMLLDYFDGSRPVSQIALATELPFSAVLAFARRLANADLVELRPIDPFS